MGKKGDGFEWSSTAVQDGIRTIECQSWDGYVEFLNGTLLDYRSYIFRGHGSSTWSLESTLDRALKGTSSEKNLQAQKQHLDNFKLAVRGRRGRNPSPLEIENDWWALGQHHGLATPLLDWTESPYVAAYFAFCRELEVPASSHRIIYALSRNSVEKKNKKLTPAKAIQLVRPMSDENPRLITQRGLFTKVPNGETVESWITQHFKGESGGAKLLRINIPSSSRVAAMKSLNRMNINHLSLFPDLYGAAKFCNYDLIIEKY